jgi:hypothetical protein
VVDFRPFDGLRPRRPSKRSWPREVACMP